MEKRQASIERNTKETQIKLTFAIDGEGKAAVATGVGFFDHMLDLFSKHGLFDLDLSVTGDLEIDAHHTVEDVGICLGQAFQQALGTGKGINRYASAIIPMDESLCQIAIDVSNRPALGFNHNFEKDKVGEFDSELVEEFFNAFVNNARINLHIDMLKGTNLHHKIEACFKAFGVCLDRATQRDPRKKDIPSTKGIL
ncbi:imidazoleglycerol-phosphate dehydratase HisB [Candidatus Marinamargulisbacteria bacterium SCGC AG-414-C22]|nr:imidazoleglycerol-phosphate dehydratase HisB [Candidatus Marinamargulisbacteria bacterium SCGC AG-414-C22]